jgi:hypothetical protein
VDAGQLAGVDGVMDPAPVLGIAAFLDQPGSPQDPQMVADEVLGLVEQAHELAVAGLSRHELEEDPPPCRIGHQLEKPLDPRR